MPPKKQEEFVPPPEGDPRYSQPPISQKYASTYNKKKQQSNPMPGQSGSPGSLSSRPMPGGNFASQPPGSGF
jgi:hypothetical protein